MIKFNIPYNDLINAHNDKEIIGDKAYKELILPIKDPWKDLDNIIEFVRRWNKRVPIGKNKDKIKEAVLSLKKEFGVFEDCYVENFDFTQQNIELIKKIYDTLSKIILSTNGSKTNHLGDTGATKLMHGINPNLFVMWDKGICKHYGCYPNSIGYIRFMESMHGVVLEILKQHNKENIINQTCRTLPKLMDEYNWVHFRTSKA